MEYRVHSQGDTLESLYTLSRRHFQGKGGSAGLRQETFVMDAVLELLAGTSYMLYACTLYYAYNRHLVYAILRSVYCVTHTAGTS